MAIYLISYDLLGRPTMEDYKPLTDDLKRTGAKEILRSQWVLNSNLDPMQIRDNFSKHLDAKDRILVIEIGRWAGWNTLVNISEIP